MEIWKFLRTSVVVYIMLKELYPSMRMIQIKDIFTTFSNHLRRSSLSESIVFFLTSNSLLVYSVSYFPLLQYEKRQMILGNEAAVT